MIIYQLKPPFMKLIDEKRLGFNAMFVEFKNCPVNLN